MAMMLEIVSTIEDIETITIDRAIRKFDRLRRVYVPGKWRKRKGIATVRIGTGMLLKAEIQKYIGTKPTGLEERSSRSKGY